MTDEKLKKANDLQKAIKEAKEHLVRWENASFDIGRVHVKGRHVDGYGTVEYAYFQEETFSVIRAIEIENRQRRLVELQTEYEEL